MEKNNIDLLPGFCIDTPNKQLTQQSCLNYMNVHNDNYILNHKSYQTSPMFIKKTEKTVKLIEEWLKYSQIPECIVKKTKFHQCDQAILNILLLKFEYKAVYCNSSKLETKSHNFFINLFYKDNIVLE